MSANGPPTTPHHPRIDRYLKQFGLLLGALIPLFGLSYDRVPDNVIGLFCYVGAGIAAGLGFYYAWLERKQGGAMTFLSPLALWSFALVLGLLPTAKNHLFTEEPGASAPEARADRQDAGAEGATVAEPTVKAGAPIVIGPKALLPPAIGFRPASPADADFARRLEVAVRERLTRTPSPEGLAIKGEVRARSTNVAAQLVVAEVRATLEVPGSLRKCLVEDERRGPVAAAAAQLAETIARQAAIMNESRTQC